MLFGALIIGQAAVDAGIVSPILIIIVAITGITSFAIPDYYLAFHCRVARFVYIVLGYFAGLLGIAIGVFIHLLIAANIQSFGVSYLSPYIRPDFLDTKREDKQEHISMKWKYPNQSN